MIGSLALGVAGLPVPLVEQTLVHLPNLAPVSQTSGQVQERAQAACVQAMALRLHLVLAMGLVKIQMQMQVLVQELWQQSLWLGHFLPSAYHLKTLVHLWVQKASGLELAPGHAHTYQTYGRKLRLPWCTCKKASCRNRC